MRATHVETCHVLKTFKAVAPRSRRARINDTVRLDDGREARVVDIAGDRMLVRVKGAPRFKRCFWIDRV